MRNVTYIFVLFLLSLISCQTDEAFDFAPPMDPAATYRFSITPASGSGSRVFNLTEITQVASKVPGTAGNQFYTFMLKGKHKATEADVVISGRTRTYDSYLNIAVTENGQTTFYKDCNNFSCQTDTASNSRGKYLKIINVGSQCITTTLASERSMTIVTQQVQLDPMMFYIQE